MLSVLIAVACGLGGLIALMMLGVAWYLVVSRPRRKPEPGFEYVWVEDGGSVFELNPNDQAWLREYFAHSEAPWGGGRPSFKTHYAARLQGRIDCGFIERRKIPPRVSIAPAQEFNSLEQQIIDAGIPLDG